MVPREKSELYYKQFVWFFTKWQIIFKGHKTFHDISWLKVTYYWLCQYYLEQRFTTAGPRRIFTITITYNDYLYLHLNIIENKW